MGSWTRAGATGLMMLGATVLGACGQAGDASPQPGEATGESAAADPDRLNPMISLMENGHPVFGLYAPSARTRVPAGTEAPSPRSAEELAAETVAFQGSDFVFDGSMEGGVDENLPAFTAFAAAMHEAGATAATHPLVVKMSSISEDPEAATGNVGRQLDLGVSAIMFVEVESAEELETGIAAMRFAEQGGTRSSSVGVAPAYWSLSEEEYRTKADLWPTNPQGELVSWAIIETHEGLANVREIAAVEGLGVLWPGAGSLRGVFSTTGADGERVVDAEGWENAIQSVLAACKEFDVPCGYPANADDIQLRMEQGFNVFVMGWGDGGFRTIEMGRSVSGR